jgi:hypothetical protein
VSELFDRWWVARNGSPPDSAEERKTYHRLHAAWTAIASIKPVDALELVGLRLPQVVVQVYRCPACATVNRVRTAPVLAPVDHGPDGTPIMGVLYPPTVMICDGCDGLFMEDELPDPIVEWHEKATVEDLKE